MTAESGLKRGCAGFFCAYVENAPHDQSNRQELMMVNGVGRLLAGAVAILSALGMELLLLVDIFTVGSSDKFSMILQPNLKLVPVGSCRVHLPPLSGTRVRHPQTL